jgi:hypothetical protein
MLLLETGKLYTGAQKGVNSREPNGRKKLPYSENTQNLFTPIRRCDRSCPQRPSAESWNMASSTSPALTIPEEKK